MDPREERSARVLRDKIFELASERDIATVTAAELSLATGLARRTIYNHGEGPQELLFRHLAHELTQIRDSGVAEADGRTALETFEVGLRRVLAHVQQHRAIYFKAVSTSSSPAWHHLLAQHFIVSLTLYTEMYPARLATLGTTDDDRAIAVAAVAHSMVGAIEAWLRLDADTEPQYCHRLVMALIPRWFLTDD